MRHFHLCPRDRALVSRRKIYQGIFLLFLFITMSPWQSAFPAISRSTDAKGTIRITNDPQAAPNQDNVDVQASGNPSPAESINPQEPTPSNIFPEPGAPVTPAFLSANPESPPESGDYQ